MYHSFFRFSIQNEKTKKRKNGPFFHFFVFEQNEKTNFDTFFHLFIFSFSKSFLKKRTWHIACLGVLIYWYFILLPACAPEVLCCKWSPIRQWRSCCVESCVRVGGFYYYYYFCSWNKVFWSQLFLRRDGKKIAVKMKHSRINPGVAFPVPIGCVFHKIF